MSPIDGQRLGGIKTDNVEAVGAKISRAEAAFRAWRDVPAPKRGELIRLFGEELRAHKDALGRLVTIESGKILEEGRGEVQEAIDICDFALGLSRQLYGRTIASERPGHRMMETWHPLGVVGVITAFNFPVAVWSWNFALAIVCGNALVWKPSEKTPFTALASAAIFARACARFGAAPPGLLDVSIGARDVGEAIAADPRVALVSATCSTRMGRALAPVVAARLGRTLLELGGNNALIVAPSADLELAVRAILFAAVGTAGQRCTTLRRLIVHDQVYDQLLPRLKRAYASVAVGDPLARGTLVGPLIDRNAFVAMAAALDRVRAEGASVTGGERVDVGGHANAFYVTPAIAEVRGQTAIVRTETFAPILYVLRYRTFDEAIRLHNNVPQGLASSIFTNDVREAEAFMAAAGSDCGIVNVNIGPSGAEIGGAFGGEKETGGGRESGSDAWKAYMRRATNTVNYSRDLPLAQGIRFAVD
ncbi:MAG: aldehyde dehydrogenase family protein [Alphaproteobacteria bacterium]|nr:aldehyde dehydrogenase family protein [Alphaproteobacteria bacterium]